MVQPKQTFIRFLRCVLCRFTFSVSLERLTDLTMSHLSDLGEVSEGYAIYRDKVFVKCPQCASFCKVLEDAASIEVFKR